MRCTSPCRYEYRCQYSSGLYDDNTLLHLACKNGHLNIAQYLIGELQCKPARYTTRRKTLLHYACENGHLNITQYLIEVAHCNPACRDPLRNTPLHLACSNGYIKIVRYLINGCHCDPSCTDTRGNTPLHEACTHGQIEIAKYLINDCHCYPSCTKAFGHTPLHQACSSGHIEIARYLINDCHCDPSCIADTRGNTPLHLACLNGRIEIARCLINDCHCDPSCTDARGNTPLHLACSNGHIEIARYLIKDCHCNPSCTDARGNTSLHQACSNGHIEIARYLIKDCYCNPSCTDTRGNTPLHLACSNGHIEIARYLIKDCHCNPSCTDARGNTSLHQACSNGHIEIARYLIKDCYCNPSCTDTRGNTPLHLACSNGHIEIARYLIKDCHCNPSCTDARGNTPLHLACSNGQIEIARYLINDLHCDPSCIGYGGLTPLHYACKSNHALIAKFLLSIGQVNPLVEDQDCHTPLYYASGNYEIIKLFESFEKCRVDFPVHTFTKLILTGDSGAGKTTTANCLVHLADSTANVPVEYVPDVEQLTAGIVQHRIQSEKTGNFIIYDFAGQQEYYSSHAAVLEQVMRKSPAMFLCLIDLSKSNESISQSLNYWISFIDNACSSIEGKSHVLIVGSHADRVTSSVEENRLILQTIATRRIKRQEYVGCVAMDCRRPDNEYLISVLTDSQSSIAESQPIISYYNHVVYAFLQTKLDVVGCTLDHLITKIKIEDDSSLPTDISDLTETLTTLSDKGLILFIHDPQSVSWVIVKTEALLTEVNGTLFAPDHFVEHRADLASNTGIVSISSLSRIFPDYDPKLLVSFLKSLHFCRQVDYAVLKNTNLQTTPSCLTTDLLFFPGLVQLERPKNLVPQGALQFGWCLKCINPNEFFSTRFLHVLLLSVAYKFPLVGQDLHRMCKLWKNGIFWRNYDNITTVIEVLDNNRRVVVAMSCDESDHTSQTEHAKLRSSLISLIRSLQHEYCSILSVREFLISPDLVRQYPMDLPDSDLFNICHVARAMLLRKKVVPSYKDSSGCLRLQSLPFEPYHRLEAPFICQLLNPDKADEEVSASLLHRIQKLCHQEPQVYKDLREYIDGLSLFAGRNPLVSTLIS